MNFRISEEKAMRMIAKATFREFTKLDFTGYAGVETSDPLICDDVDGWTAILDGKVAQFIDSVNDDFCTFTLNE